MAFRFIKGTKGKDLIELNNFLYRCDNSQRPPMKYYCCRRRQDARCGDRLAIYGNTKITVLHEKHEHEPDTEYIIQLEIKNKIKEKIEDSNLAN